MQTAQDLRTCQRAAVILAGLAEGLEILLNEGDQDREAVHALASVLAEKTTTLAEALGALDVASG
ncbi:MAG: hypothetical protein R3D84_15485 [Paracoccaceae bacterium]